MRSRPRFLTPVDRTDGSLAMVFVLHDDGELPLEARVLTETEHAIELGADTETLAAASPTPGTEVLIAMPDGRWLLGAAGAARPDQFIVRLVAPVAEL